MHQHHALRTIFEGTQYYHLGIYLSHRVAIVTDGDHGIGLQTAHELALRGAHVYLTCRRRESGERACEEVQQRSRNRNVFARVLDMGSLMSVRQFVTRLVKKLIEKKTTRLLEFLFLSASSQSNSISTFS